MESLARELSPEAMERLAFWMRSDNAKASVTACLAVMNRGFGMPKNTTDLTVTDKRMVVEAPAPAKDADEWANTHRPH